MSDSESEHSASESSASYSSAADVRSQLPNRQRPPAVAEDQLNFYLLQAVKEGVLGVARAEELLNAGASANYAGRHGYTPLLLAIESRCAVLCSTLLRAQADPNQVAQRVIPPLHPFVEAVRQAAAEIIQLLLQARADPNAGQPPVHPKNACSRPAMWRTRTIGAKVERSKLTESNHELGITALHIAASGGHERIVCLLLEHRASVHEKDHLRFTPLARAESEQVSHHLLEARASIECEKWALPPQEDNINCHPHLVRYGTPSERTHIEARRACGFTNKRQYCQELANWKRQHYLAAFGTRVKDPWPRHAHLDPPKLHSRSVLRAASAPLPPRKHQVAMFANAGSSPTSFRRMAPLEPSGMVGCGCLWREEQKNNKFGIQ